MHHVAFCFDQGYQQHFGAAVTSLLMNDDGPGSDLCVHVVTDVVDARLQRGLERLHRLFGATFEVHVPAREALAEVAGLPANNPWIVHLSTSTYLRWLIPDVLPESADRVLYLDTDTIVLRSLRPLLEMDIQGHPLAGVLDMNSGELMGHHQIPAYINSGVLLMNLDVWRREALSRRCIAFAQAHPEQLRYADQCAVNLVLAGRVKLLDRRWNAPVAPIQGLEIREDAAILHFLTGDKPWQAWYSHPRGRDYWRYLDVSPWAGARPQEPRNVGELRRMAMFLHASGRHAEACEMFARALYVMDLQANK